MAIGLVARGRLRNHLALTVEGRGHHRNKVSHTRGEPLGPGEWKQTEAQWPFQRNKRTVLSTPAAGETIRPGSTSVSPELRCHTVLEDGGNSRLEGHQSANEQVNVSRKHWHDFQLALRIVAHFMF